MPVNVALSIVIGIVIGLAIQAIYDLLMNYADYYAVKAHRTDSFKLKFLLGGLMIGIFALVIVILVVLYGW